MSDHDNAVAPNQTASVDEDIDHFLRGNDACEQLSVRFDRKRSAQCSTGSVVETHCARLYLSDSFVVKIKRPVSYSYLNLTALSTRRHICERELAVNQTTLPDIYLTVAAIVEDRDAQLAFAFDPAAINDPKSVREWCLIMRRFDEACVLDNVAQRGEFNIDLARDTGRSIALYHQSLPTTRCDDGDIRVDELIAELEFELKRLDRVFSENKIDQLIEDMYSRLRQVKGQLRLRSEQGFVRRCHGDLHLRNILLRDSGPTPFDALEFDERLATTDVLYDLAFLVMDLCHRDLIPEANVVLNEYLLHSDERNVSGVALMDLFISIRACIRAMTTAQTIAPADLELPSPKIEKVLAESLSYIALAQIALTPKKPTVIAIGGFSGSGKSTVARQLPARLCQLPGAVLLSSDAERKNEFGIPREQSLGVDHYTKANSVRVYDRLSSRMVRAIDSAYPVIVDATFLTSKNRNNLEQSAVERNVDFFGFWLTAPVEIMRKRIESRHEDASDATVAVLDKQLAQEKGQMLWQVINTDTSVENVVDTVCRVVSNARHVRAVAADDA